MDNICHIWPTRNLAFTGIRELNRRPNTSVFRVQSFAMRHSVILDCYTDEPSGYGVRPYLGTHQLHLSHALHAKGEPHYYLTIDDLRSQNKLLSSALADSDLSTLNTTKNSQCAIEILRDATTIYVIMGCFVEYDYFSCRPPKCDEVANYLRGLPAKKILFYVMGTLDGISPDYKKSQLSQLIDVVEHGNTYRLVMEERASGKNVDLINPNYPLLERISKVAPPVITQIKDPIIAEIETGTGCNTPTCRFCIEAERSPKVTYRTTFSILDQIQALYLGGVRHFRLGRQPNFFHYHQQDVSEMERLLAGIRERCPDIRTLHIDNVNIINVITKQGRQIAKLVARYCTSGNVTPFGIESFDPTVRKATRVAGTVEQVLEAIRIINEVGAERGANGIPKLLPGVNLIYGLPGHNARTHELNLKALASILNCGLMTYRLYFRNMTAATGVSFGAGPECDEEFKKAFEQISSDYVLPMQSRVYPTNTLMRDDFECIRKDGTSYARALGTCSIKLRIESDDNHDRFLSSAQFRVLGNAGHRQLSVTKEP